MSSAADPNDPADPGAAGHGTPSADEPQTPLWLPLLGLCLFLGALVAFLLSSGDAETPVGLNPTEQAQDDPSRGEDDHGHDHHGDNHPH